MCTLEVTNIYKLKFRILPIFKAEGETVPHLKGGRRAAGVFKLNNLNSKKYLDFKLWSMLIDIVYYGYHRIDEGKILFNEITSKLNKLTRPLLQDERHNRIENIEEDKSKTVQEFEKKLTNLFNISSPYDIIGGVRFVKGSNKLVSNSVTIKCLNVTNKQISYYTSITECAKELNIDRSTIKKYLISGQPYNNYYFFFNRIAQR